MAAQTLLKIMARLFLFAGIVGLVVGVGSYLRAASPSEYGAMFVGGTFWLFCSAIAFFLRSRLA